MSTITTTITAAEFELLGDLSFAFNNPKFCDVTIEVQGSNASVHACKFILCARSEYFRTMFSADMQESREGKVLIEGSNYSAVLELMRFLHTGKAILTAENVFGVLPLALKYDIQTLILCLNQFVVQVLNIDNCIPLLIEADYLETVVTKVAAKKTILKFICAHFNRVGSSEDLKLLPVHLHVAIFRLKASIDAKTARKAGKKATPLSTIYSNYPYEGAAAGL